MALPGITNRFIGYILDPTNDTCAELESTKIENVKGDDVTSSDFPQDVFDRDLCIFQDEGSRRGTSNAHLMLLRTRGNSGEIALNNETAKFLTIHFCKSDEDMSKAGIGDPHLRAVENVVFAIRAQDGCRFGRQGVGARLSLS